MFLYNFEIEGLVTILYDKIIIYLSRTKRFGGTFLCRNVDKGKSLPAHVFLLSFDIESLKRGVKRHLVAGYSWVVQ